MSRVESLISQVHTFSDRECDFIKRDYYTFIMSLQAAEGRLLAADLRLQAAKGCLLATGPRLQAACDHSHNHEQF